MSICPTYTNEYKIQVVCTPEQGQGLEILAAFMLRGGALFLDVDVSENYRGG